MRWPRPWIPTDPEHHYYRNAWAESEKRRVLYGKHRKTRKGAIRRISGYSQSSVARQLATSDAIDSKLTWVFAAGALVVGLAAAAGQGTDGDGGSLVLTCLLATGGAAFAVAAFAAANGLWPRKWEIGLEPPWLYEKCRKHRPERVDHDIAWAHAVGYPLNKAMLAGKTKCLQRATVAVAIEVAVVAAAVAYSQSL